MLSPEDKTELTRLEEAMWRPETRFDLAFQETRFAEDFIEFGRSGRVYSRAETILTDKKPIDATLPLQGLAFRQLDKHTVLLTYNSEAVYDGVREQARRSSIWSRTPSGWIMRFHQGTPYNTGESAVPPSAQSAA
jgi:hypothetical protein